MQWTLAWKRLCPAVFYDACLVGDLHVQSEMNIKGQQRLPKPAPMTERRRRGPLLLIFITFRIMQVIRNIGERKSPSFSGFGPFRRLLSLLGWLGRFFVFCTVVLFECIALYVFAAFCYARPVARKTFSNSNVQFFAARFGCGILTTSVSLSVQTKLLL